MLPLKNEKEKEKRKKERKKKEEEKTEEKEKQKQKTTTKNVILQTSPTASKRLRIGPKDCILKPFKTSRARTI